MEKPSHERGSATEADVGSMETQPRGWGGPRVPGGTAGGRVLLSEVSPGTTPVLFSCCEPPGVPPELPSPGGPRGAARGGRPRTGQPRTGQPPLTPAFLSYRAGRHSGAKPPLRLAESWAEPFAPPPGGGGGRQKWGRRRRPCLPPQRLLDVLL